MNAEVGPPKCPRRPEKLPSLATTLGLGLVLLTAAIAAGDLHPHPHLRIAPGN